MFSKLSTKQIVLALGCIGFILRLCLALKMGIATPPTSDATEFDTYAWNIAQGRGYRGLSADVSDQDHLTAYRPPVPSMVWAALYLAFGHRYDVIRVAHCLIGALTIPLVFIVGRRCFDERVGLVAAAMFTIWPMSLLASTTLLSEPISELLFVGYVVAAFRFADRPGLIRAVWAGVLLGITMLARPSAVFMVPLAGVWAIWQFRGNWRTACLALLVPLFSILTLVPWAVRNYMIFHAFIPLSTMGGSALLQANNRIVTADPLYYGYTVWDTKIPEYRDALMAPNDELQRDRVAQRLAVEWLKNNPDKWRFLVVEKMRRAWSPFLQPHSPRLYRLGTLLSWGPVLLLFLASVIPTLVSFLRERHPGWLIHLAILHFVANTIIFHGLTRYRYSIEPFCIILAVVPVVWLWDKLRGHHA